MKLFFLSQDENHGYDTFSSMVVCAEDEASARLIHPSNHWSDKDPWKNRWSSWCSSPDKVKVEYIGEAAAHMEHGIVCSSFHAG